MFNTSNDANGFDPELDLDLVIQVNEARSTEDLQRTMRMADRRFRIRAREARAGHKSADRRRPALLRVLSTNS